MKLSPPASSSDLEIAREVARRLNQQRRRDDRSAAAPSAAGEPAPQPMRLTPPPLPSRPEASPPREPLRAEPRPEPQRSEATRRAQEPPGPSPEDDLFSSVPSFATPDPAPAAFEPPAWNPSEVAPDADLASDADTVVEVSEPEAEDEPLEALAHAGPALLAPEPSLEVEVDADEAQLPDEMVGGEIEEASPLDQLTEPEPSPFDDGLLDEPAGVEEPAGPSWEEIVESCREIAHAKGAMLIDPAGQVFAARGDWPTPPGPSAIATRLVAKMEAELKNAPTRSISAPFMGLHLTAWRVQLHEGLMTVAFIGRTPVRPDTRPAVDNEIHRGTGA